MVSNVKINKKIKKDDENNIPNAKPSWSQIAQRKPPPPSTKGKVKSTTAFKGAVPEIFLYNCDINVTSTDVAEYFQSQNVKVRKVEKKSHQFSLSPYGHLPAFWSRVFWMIDSVSNSPLESISRRRFEKF